jgi:peptide/nickel transport system permease protein
MSDVTLTGPDLTAPKARGRRRVHPLAWFVLRRLAIGAVTLVVASIVIFLGTSVIPGSPATAVLGRQASPEAIAAINHRIGYDKPLLERYGIWLKNAVQGNLGNSTVAEAQGSKAPNWPLIRGPFGNTVVLALSAVLFLIPLSLLFGLIAGLHAGKWPDHLISTLTMVFMALPEFVVGSLLIVIFSVWLDVLPPVSLLAPGSSPLAHPNILVLPVLTLLAVSVAWTIRLVRVGTIEVVQTDYVQMARLQGISERKVLRRYVLRNALAPSVQIFALSIQYLFGGVIVTETVFNYPGLGKALVNAVLGNDNTQVQAIAMILATIYILINILADLIVVLLVPKLRTQA